MRKTKLTIRYKENTKENTKNDYQIIATLFGPLGDINKYNIVINEVKARSRDPLWVNNVKMYTFGKDNTNLCKSLGFETQEVDHISRFPDYASCWWCKHKSIQEELKISKQCLLIDYDTNILTDDINKIFKKMSSNTDNICKGELQFPAMLYRRTHSIYRKKLLKNNYKIYENNELFLEGREDYRIVGYGAALYHKEGEMINELLESYKESYKVLNSKLREEQQVIFYLDIKYGIMNYINIFKNFDIKYFGGHGYENRSVYKRMYPDTYKEKERFLQHRSRIK